MNINNCYIGKITQLVDEDMYEARSIYNLAGKTMNL